MGVRVCGATCHNAKGSKCRCWCAGLFHSSRAADSREHFRRTLGVDKLPTTERAFRELVDQPSLFVDGDQERKPK
jgi:hypothetical protein